MKIYDLTHLIETEMTVYPGTPAPRLQKAAALEWDGYRETEMILYSHLGTHMDAPAHLLKDGETLDRISAERFLGTAFVLDVSGMEKIERSSLLQEDETIRAAEFLLLHTGWERYWKEEQYLAGFPVLTEEAAVYLASLPQLKGLGMDTVSPDPVGGAALVNHRHLLGAGKLLIENLTGLAPLCGKKLCFAALPLHYAAADGAPVRAAAWEDE